MNNKTVLDRIEAAEKELALAKKALSDEVTYSIGDRFKTEGGNKYILCPPKSGGYVEIFSLDAGTRCEPCIKVSDVYRIPAERLTTVLGEWGLTRYWDSRKGVRCDS